MFLAVLSVGLNAAAYDPQYARQGGDNQTASDDGCQDRPCGVSAHVSLSLVFNDHCAGRRYSVSVPSGLIMRRSDTLWITAQSRDDAVALLTLDRMPVRASNATPTDLQTTVLSPALVAAPIAIIPCWLVAVARPVVFGDVSLYVVSSQHRKLATSA